MLRNAGTRQTIAVCANPCVGTFLSGDFWNLPKQVVTSSNFVPPRDSRLGAYTATQHCQKLFGLSRYGDLTVGSTDYLLPLGRNKMDAALAQCACLP